MISNKLFKLYSMNFSICLGGTSSCENNYDMQESPVGNLDSALSSNFSNLDLNQSKNTGILPYQDDPLLQKKNRIFDNFVLKNEKLFQNSFPEENINLNKANHQVTEEMKTLNLFIDPFINLFTNLIYFRFELRDLIKIEKHVIKKMFFLIIDVLKDQERFILMMNLENLKISTDSNTKNIEKLEKSAKLQKNKVKIGKLERYIKESSGPKS